MNPLIYIRIFAWIAIVALVCSIFSEFWLPMLCGAVAVTLLSSLVATSRR
jgi:predicted PurR-regulated permease PerM